LDVAGHVPQIDQQTIGLCHPHKRISFNQAGKRPLWIERPSSEHFFNHARLRVKRTGIKKTIAASVPCSVTYYTVLRATRECLPLAQMQSVATSAFQSISEEKRT